MLGSPHRGLPEDIVAMVLQSAGQQRLTERPGASLQPADFGAAKSKVQTLKAANCSTVGDGHNAQVVAVTEEDVLSSLIYPKVYADYVNFVGDNSAVTFLPSNVFWYGMVPKQSATFSLPHSLTAVNGFGNIYDNIAIGSGTMVDLTLTLDRIEGIKNRDQRTLHFIAENPANGRKETIKVELTDEIIGGAANMVMADSKDETQIAAPLAGQVEFIAAAGTSVIAGDPLAIIVAMKMEVTVKAPFDLIVNAVELEKGGTAQEGCLLCHVKKG